MFVAGITGYEGLFVISLIALLIGAAIALLGAIVLFAADPSSPHDPGDTMGPSDSI
jgi:hypothetical protein